MKWLQRLWKTCLFLVLLGLGFIVWVNLAAVHAGKGRLFDSVHEVPETKVGLVFGCDNEIDGRENKYFRYRVNAAAELYKAGKVKLLLISGDNREKYYNEPLAFFLALEKEGVPRKHMVMDFAGRSTLGSVVRAKEIFGVNEVVVITQKFQNERAIYIGKGRYGDDLKMWGYNAQDVNLSGGSKTKLREVAARVKMWLDVHIWDTQPEVMGNKEILPL